MPRLTHPSSAGRGASTPAPSTPGSIATQMAAFETILRDLLTSVTRWQNTSAEWYYIPRIVSTLGNLHFVVEEAQRYGELSTNEQDTRCVIATYIGIAHSILSLSTTSGGRPRDALMETREFRACLSWTMWMWTSGSVRSIQIFRTAVADRTFHQLYILRDAFEGSTREQKNGPLATLSHLLLQLCGILNPLKTITGTADHAPEVYGRMRQFWPFLGAELSKISMQELRAPPRYSAPPIRHPQPIQAAVTPRNPHRSTASSSELIHPALRASKGGVSLPATGIVHEGSSESRRFWRAPMLQSTATTGAASETPPVPRHSSFSPHMATGTRSAISPRANFTAAMQHPPVTVQVVQQARVSGNGDSVNQLTEAEFIISLAKQFPLEHVTTEKSFYRWLTIQTAHFSMPVQSGGLKAFFGKNKAEICRQHAELGRLFQRFEEVRIPISHGDVVESELSQTRTLKRKPCQALADALVIEATDTKLGIPDANKRARLLSPDDEEDLDEGISLSAGAVDPRDKTNVACFSSETPIAIPLEEFRTSENAAKAGEEREELPSQPFVKIEEDHPQEPPNGAPTSAGSPVTPSNSTRVGTLQPSTAISSEDEARYFVSSTSAIVPVSGIPNPSSTPDPLTAVPARNPRLDPVDHLLHAPSDGLSEVLTGNGTNDHGCGNERQAEEDEEEDEEEEEIESGSIVSNDEGSRAWLSRRARRSSSPLCLVPRSPTPPPDSPVTPL